MATATPLGIATPAPIITTTPLTTPTPFGTPTPIATAKPTPTPSPLTGVWQWQGLTGQGSGQLQNSLPNIALHNALSGNVAITTNAFADTVRISGNSCPASFNVQANMSAGITFSVNNSVFRCQFTLTDPTTGNTVLVNYTNE